MWHVHAFATDGSQDAYITPDMTAISQAEADEIRAQPPSAEYQAKLEEGHKALGGRNAAVYPPKEFKEAIGHICVNSSQVEATLRTVIWTVGGLDAERGMAFTGGARSVDDLIDTLKMLIKIRHPNLTEVTTDLTGKLRAQFNKRGEFVHGMWTVGPDKQPMVGKYLSGRELKDGRSITLDEMYDLAESFLQLQGEFMNNLLFPLIAANQQAKS